MREAQERPRTDQELRAREDLMRQQFERDTDSWEKATPLEDVLKKLNIGIAAGSSTSTSRWNSSRSRMSVGY